MKPKTRTVLTITLSWTLLAILLFLYAHYYLVVALPPDQLSGLYYPKANFTGYVISSLLGGAFFGYLMIFRSYYKTRRKTFILRCTSNSSRSLSPTLPTPSPTTKARCTSTSAMRLSSPGR